MIWLYKTFLKTIKYVFIPVGFVRARMSTGYAILMDIDGKEIKFGHMAKFSGMKKLAAKSSTLCSYEKIKMEVACE